MASALIGYTGFVGSNLLAVRPFDQLYRSTNIDEIRGQEFRLLVCAGAPAQKWQANQDPEADRANLDRLQAALASCRADVAVLISTVDVYPDPRGVDERTPIAPGSQLPYGCHRHELERFFREHFPRRLIVRLPGLFGVGLKKNAIFDLLHENLVERIHPDSVYQLYHVARLWEDVERAQDAGIELLNVATPPVSVGEIARVAFDRVLEPPPGRSAARYDLRSCHGALWGQDGPYLYSRAQNLEELYRFVRDERARLAEGR